MLLSEVLSVTNFEELKNLLDKYDMGNIFSERSPNIEKYFDNWRFVGDNESNASVIGILNNGEKGIVERITNAVDAVIERKKEEFRIAYPKKTTDVIKEAFPHYYDNIQKIRQKENGRLNAVEAKNQVVVAINDGKKSNRPSIDVIDVGTGILGTDFANTILSLHSGNKIKTEKNYLIGAFGQGGSTSLAFAAATIIVSKFNGNYYFTVAISVKPKGYKNKVYVYLVTEHKNIIKLENDSFLTRENDYLEVLLNNSNGTIVRMIECDISKQFRDNDITKPGMLHDYFNTELFDIGYPVKVVENRKQYKENIHDQNRYVYGSNLKLKTSQYRLPEYSGSFDIEFRGMGYTIHYHTILPINKEYWGKDNKCKEVYRTFNVHEKPIIFTVNGQYINGERFTKIKNAGLNFMKYRLLVHVDLDVLGDKKYDFFTTDRNHIISSDLTSEFIDKLVKQLAQVEPLIEINKRISELAIEGAIDEELLKSIADKVKNKYQRYLQQRKNKSELTTHGTGGTNNQEEIFHDEILQMNITNTKRIYKIGSVIHVVLNTLARKDINIKHATEITCFLNDRQVFPIETYMNGRIQYNISDLLLGEYKVKFIRFDGSKEIMESNEYVFSVVDNDDRVDTSEKTNLNIEIKQVNGRELISDMVKKDKKIIIYICLSHAKLQFLYRGKTESDINEMKKKLIEPIALYTLFMDDYYNNLETELKNSTIFNLCRTIIESDGI